MPHTQTNSIRSDIDRPLCPQCGSEMWLARVRPDGPGKEHRTFNCPVCEISTGDSDLLRRGTSTSLEQRYKRD